MKVNAQYLAFDSVVKAAAFAAALLCLAPSLRAQFTYSEDFKNSTAPGWNLYQQEAAPAPRLTSGATPTTGDPETGATIDPSGQGWLRLATATNNQANGAYFDTPIPSAGNKVTITFDATMWGGTADGSGRTGDGLTFFLYDAAQSFTPGARGGSLGYAQMTASVPAEPGLSNAYLGVALDVYGNFSNPTEGRVGGVGLAPNAVVMRGPGNGFGDGLNNNYNYLAGTSGSNGTVGYDYTDTGSATVKDGGDGVVPALPFALASPGATSRPDQTTGYRKVEFTLDENSQATVRMQFGENGQWYTVLSVDMSSFSRPESLRLGFSAGTGGATEVYEVGGLLQVTATAGTGNFFWDNGYGTSVWGTGVNDPINWLGNTNPTLKSNVLFNSVFISSPQSIDVTGSDKVVSNMYFSGPNAYTLTTSESRKIIFDNDATTGGITTISLTNDATGNANHTLGLALQMNKNLEVINNLDTGHTFTISGAVDNGGNTLTSKGMSATTFSGVISGAGDFVKSGTGTTVLAGSSSNTFTGATTITNGILQLEKAGALGSSSSVTVTSDPTGVGTLALGGTGTTFAPVPLQLNNSGYGGNGALRNVAGNNTWQGTVSLNTATSIGVDPGTALNVSGIVSGVAANTLTKLGAGTLQLSGANTYSGATLVSAGTVQIGADNNLGTAPGAATAGQLTLDGGTLQTTANFTLNANRGIALGAGDGTIQTNTGTTLTYNGIALGAGDLNKTGGGTLALGGANNYGGATNINAGTLQLGASNVLPNTTAVTVASGATFDVNNRTETVSSLAGAGTVTLGTGTGTLILAGAGTSTTFSGAINGSTGDKLQLNAGTTFTLGKSNVFGDATTLALNGGTLAVGGSFSDTVGRLTLAASSSLDYINNTSTLTFTDANRTAGTLTIYNWAGDLSGGGASQLKFTNAETGFANTNIVFDGYTTGYTRLASGEIVPTTGGTVFTWNATGATWAANANWDSTPDGFPGATGDTAIFGSALTSNLTLSLAANRTLGYLVFNDNNNVTLQNNTLNFDVTTGYAQINVMNTGTDQISSAVTLSNALKINQNSTGLFTIAGGITNAGAADYGITVTGTGNTTLSGVVGIRTGGFTMNGTGTLTLSGANTFTGATTVNAGIVAIAMDGANAGNAGNLGAVPGAATPGQLTLNGGTLENTATMALHANRGVALGASGGTFQTDTGTTLTYGGIIAGAAGGALNKTGAGTLTLSGNNTYNGATNIHAGTLQLGAANRLPDATAVSIDATGTLNVAGFSDTVGSIAGAGTINNSTGTAATLTAGGDGTSTLFSGLIKNDGGGALTLTKTGAGILTLSGNNTYSGATNVNAGTLVATSANALGATTAGATVANTATLGLGGTGTTFAAEPLTLNGTGVGGAGALHNLAGNNTWQGTVALASASNIGADSGTTLLISGVVSGANALTKVGDGTVALSGNNTTYTGATTVSGGILEIRSVNALGTTGAGVGTTVSDGATLAISGNITSAESPLTVTGTGYSDAGALRSLSGANTFSGAITLQGTAGFGVDAGSTLTASGVISSSAGASLSKVGTGKLILSGGANNTYSGNTAISAGTLEIQKSGALGTTAGTTATIFDGATLGLNGNGLAVTKNITVGGIGVGGAGAIQNTGGSNTLSGTITLSGATTIASTTGNILTASGVISGPYDLVKAGDGGLTLSGTNTYSGVTTVRNGTLTLNTSAPVGANGSLGNAASTVQIGDSGTAAGNNLTLLADTAGGGLTIARAIAVNNYGSTVTIGGTNTAGTDSFTGAVALAKDVTLTAAAGGTVNFSGDVSGTGGLTKTGTGSIVLGGNNSYAGGVTITTGTLAAASNNALGTTAGATTVNTGATLDLRNVTITGEQLNLAATTAPAAASLSNSTGTNTWTGNISITGGTANDKVQIDTSSGAQLTISGVISQATNAKDLVTTGTGNLTLTGANTITGAVNINGSGGAITTLADTSGSALGNISGITVNTGNILTLGANNQINDSANLTLSGGRFNVNGYSETMRQLTQTVGSTIDYLNDGSILRFNGVIGSVNGLGALTGTLTIDNWAGSLGGNGSEQFVVYSTGAAPSVAGITFTGWGAATTIARGDLGAGYYEILPVNNGSQWKLATGGTWNTAANWNPSGVPNGAAAIAVMGNYGGALTAQRVVDLAATSETVTKVLFDTQAGAYGYTIGSTGGGKLIMGGAANQIIVNDDASHVISAAVTLNAATTITNNSAAARGLTLSNLEGNYTGDLAFNGSGTTQITGNFTRTAGITNLLQAGTGTLIIGNDAGGGAANTYTGTTTVRSGTLQLNVTAGATGSLGTAASAVVVNDASTSGATNTALLIGYAGVGLSRAVTVNNFGATTTLGSNITSGTGTFSGAITLNKNVVLTAASGGTTNFSGVLSGAGDIDKQGLGTVQLSGAVANTFTGDATVTGGTLEITKAVANGAIDDAANVTVKANATLRFNNGQNETIGSLSSEANATLDNANATAMTLTTGGNNATTTVAGTITDSGGVLNLIKTGSGTMTLTGNNTYDGTTTVSAGTLIAGSNTALGSTTGNTSVAVGATLGLQGNITVTGETLNLAATGAPAAPSLSNLSGNNTWTGAISLTGGTANDDVQIQTAAGTQLTISGAIGQATNAKDLNKTGTGTLVLSGNNSYTGVTTVTTGLLVAASSNALGATAGGTTVQNGATLGFQGNAAIGAEPITLNGTSGTPSVASLKNIQDANSVTGSITLAGGAGANVLITATAGSLALNGAITQAVPSYTNGVTKDGTGTVTLGGAAANTFSGDFNLTNGTVILNKTAGVDATGTGDVYVNGNSLNSSGGTSTLQLGASNQINNAVNVKVYAGGTLDLQANSDTIGALTLEGGSVTGAGTLTLGGTLTSTGNSPPTASISSVLDLGIAGTRTVSVGHNASLTTDLNISGAVVGAGATFAKTNAGTLMLSGGAANTFANFTMDDGKVILNKTAGVNATGSGNVTVGGGSSGALLQLAQSNQIANAATVTLNNNGTLDLNGQSETIGTLTANSGSTLMIGSGTLITNGGTIAGKLQGPGNLTVGNAGTLTISSVASDLNFGSGSITVNAGATGSTTLAFASAASTTTIGTITLNGGADLAHSAILSFGAGTYNITNLVVSGYSTIDFGNGVTVTLNGTNFTNSGSLSIANWVNAVDYFYAQYWTSATLDVRNQAPMNLISFAASSASYAASNTAWLPYGSTNMVTPAPEPSTYGAIFMSLSLVGLGLRRWRARRQQPRA